MLALVNSFIAILTAPKSDQRGLSQSTENALLVAGAVAVALIVVTAVTAYVTGKLQGLQ